VLDIVVAVPPLTLAIRGLEVFDVQAAFLVQDFGERLDVQGNAAARSKTWFTTGIWRLHGCLEATAPP
jgi:hypothetical protein